jgi:hypothetical protein
VSFIFPTKNLTANLLSKVVQIERNSCVQFAIKGTPRILPPSSLAVTAYTNNNGTAIKVLGAVNSNRTIFRFIIEIHDSPGCGQTRRDCAQL